MLDRPAAAQDFVLGRKCTEPAHERVDPQIICFWISILDAVSPRCHQLRGEFQFQFRPDAMQDEAEKVFCFVEILFDLLLYLWARQLYDRLACAISGETTQGIVASELQQG